MALFRSIWWLGYFIFGLFVLALEVGIVAEFVGGFFAVILVIMLGIPFTIFLPILAFFAYGNFESSLFIIFIWLGFIFYTFIGYYLGLMGE